MLCLKVGCVVACAFLLDTFNCYAKRTDGVFSVSISEIVYRLDLAEIQ